MVQAIVWGAVRRSGDDGHEFALADETAACRELAIERATRTGKAIPGYDRANPVVRLAQFAVKEIA